MRILSIISIMLLGVCLASTCWAAKELKANSVRIVSGKKVTTLEIDLKIKGDSLVIGNTVIVRTKWYNVEQTFFYKVHDSRVPVKKGPYTKMPSPSTIELRLKQGVNFSIEALGPRFSTNVTNGKKFGWRLKANGKIYAFGSDRLKVNVQGRRATIKVVGFNGKTKNTLVVVSKNLLFWSTLPPGPPPVA